MRIAILSTFYPFRGGIAQFNGALYNELAKNHEVKAFNFSMQYPKVLFPGKTQYVDEADGAYKIESVRSLNSVNPVSYKKTAQLIADYNPDLLVIGYWMPFMAPSLGFVAKKLRRQTKVVAIVHNAIPHEVSKVDRNLNNYFFKSLDKIVALSESVKSDILHFYPNKTVNVLPHPIYAHFGSTIDKAKARYELGLKSDKKYLLFFGLIRAYKGLDVALKTLSNLPNDYHLIIAGEAYESMEKYEAIIAENKLSERIELNNAYIPDEAVKLYFSAADACILPYKSATQSGIIAIAHHFNTPVFASDVGGLGEFIEHGKTGYLLPAEDDQSFATCIQSFFAGDDALLLKNNLAEKRKELTWEYFSQKLLQFAQNEQAS